MEDHPPRWYSIRHTSPKRGAWRTALGPACTIEQFRPDTVSYTPALTWFLTWEHVWQRRVGGGYLCSVCRTWSRWAW